MTLYVDGDAFPNLLKHILFRAIERLSLPTYVISNQRMNMGVSKHITYILVNSGADEADHRIIEMVQEGDLVITADIPLADRVITKNAHAIDHRGDLFSEENIKERLSIRNFMQDIRDSGIATKGPAPFNKKDAGKFANKLDRFLTQQLKKRR